MPCWYQWWSTARFLNLFETKDIVFLAFFVLNMVAMAAVGISAEECGTHEDRNACEDFTVSIALARFLLVAFGVYAYVHNQHKGPGARGSMLLTLIPDMVVASLWVVTGSLPHGESCGDGSIDSCWVGFTLAWWLAILIDTVKVLVLPLKAIARVFCGFKHRHLPLDLRLMVDRQDSFIILAIGEIVAASLAREIEPGAAQGGGMMPTPGHNSTHGHSNGPARGPVFWVVTLVVLLAALLKITLFDLSDHPEPTGRSTAIKHALTVCVWRGSLWTILHLPMNGAIVLLGAILEPLKTESSLPHSAQRIAAGCLGLILLISSAFDSMHDEMKSGAVSWNSDFRRVSKRGRVIARVCFAFFVMLVPFHFNWTDAKLAFLTTINVLLLLHITFMTYARMPLELSDYRRDSAANNGARAQVVNATAEDDGGAASRNGPAGEDMELHNVSRDFSLTLRQMDGADEIAYAAAAEPG